MYYITPAEEGVIQAGRQSKTKSRSYQHGELIIHLIASCISLDVGHIRKVTLFHKGDTESLVT